jgi:hypothetical protein
MFLFLYIIFFNCYIGIFAQTTQNADTIPASLTEEPFLYIIKSLRPLFQNIPKLVQQTPEESTPYIQEYLKQLTLPQRLKDKLIDFLIDKIAQLKNNKKTSIPESRLKLQMYHLLDFIDLLQILGITIQDSDFLESSVAQQISLYQKNHFPSGGTIQNLIEVTENNFRLYNIWKSRINRATDNALDIPMPEAKAVYLYYISFFRLYRKMMNNSNFLEFLNKRSRNETYFYTPYKTSDSLENFVYLLLSEAEKFDGLAFSTDSEKQNNLSYFKILEIDNIYRLLLDATLLQQNLVPIFSSHNDVSDLYNFSKPKKINSFFLFSIGILPSTPFTLTLGLPGLYLQDIPLSITPYDLSINSDIESLIRRRQHDVGHSLDILSIFDACIFDSEKFCDYNAEDCLEAIKIAFIKFLEFCDKKFTPAQIEIILKHLVDFHHEYNKESLPISKEFLSSVLNINTNPAPNTYENPTPLSELLGLDRQKVKSIINSWHKTWKKLPLKTMPISKTLKQKILEKFNLILCRINLSIPSDTHLK